jgi:hypothetical protein
MKMKNLLNWLIDKKPKVDIEIRDSKKAGI